MFHMALRAIPFHRASRVPRIKIVYYLMFSTAAAAAEDLVNLMRFSFKYRFVNEKHRRAAATNTADLCFILS